MAERSVAEIEYMVRQHPDYPVAFEAVCKVIPLEVTGVQFSAHELRTEMILAFLLGVTWARDGAVLNG